MMYMTKVWGFGATAGPLQFSAKGWRDSAVALLTPGDLVVMVGTLGSETDPAERGRLLGLMEPSIERVSALDFLRADRPEDFNKDGEYKWPYGLLNRNAWRFDEPRPLLRDISARAFNMDSAQGIVPLEPDEIAAVLRLPKTQVPLLTSFRTVARLEGHEAARGRNAPAPSTTRRGVMHMRRAAAYTYALKIEGSRPESIKIGWAFDWKARMRGFNQAAMPMIGGVRYKGFLFYHWATAIEAFRMEQALLRRFDSARHPTNREVLTGTNPDRLEFEWNSLIQRPA